MALLQTDPAARPAYEEVVYSLKGEQGGAATARAQQTALIGRDEQLGRLRAAFQLARSR